MQRSFEPGALMLRDDGRTVEGRIVPYGEVTEIAEMIDGEVIRYREKFLPDSCLAMAQGVARRGNASFIKFRLEHTEDFDTHVGYATALHSREDGAYACFRLYESRDLPKVQSMLRESHTGLSIHFGDTRPPREVDGVVCRVQVLIDHVAATPVPAYAGASITAMRTDRDGSGIIEMPNIISVREWLASEKGKWNIERVGVNE